MMRVRMVATGRVQGVGFRGFACRVANSLQLVGYAKNLPDGTVELLLEGDEKKIAQFAKRVSAIRLALGVHVDDLKTNESAKISRLTYPSFTTAY